MLRILLFHALILQVPGFNELLSEGGGFPGCLFSAFISAAAVA